MQNALVNGLKTAYYAGGIGTRHLLFIHGWASSGRMWLRSMWALRHEYAAWAVDLPGCGDSGPPDQTWRSIERYTDHVAAFCAALGIRPYAVIGHSMGGRIAFDLARRYPDLTARIVALSPTITGRLGFNLDLFLANGLLGSGLRLLRRIGPLAIVEVMSQYWAPHYLGSEAVKRTSDDLRRTNWDAATGSIRAMVEHSYAPYLADIPHPTLLIHGQRDMTVPPDDSRLAARSLREARLLELRGVHHQPTDEAPEAVLEAVRSFLV